MVSILFLDDQYERWNTFYRRFQHLDIKWVKTANDCTQAMEERDWNIVSLDHDLGNIPVVGNGMTVIRWMVDNLPDVGVIAIHSWNQPAASMMHETIYHTHKWEGNLYREVFGEKYLSDIEQIVGLFAPTG